MLRDDPFEDLRRNEITLVNQSGEKIEGVKAQVNKNTISFAAFDRVVQDGDTIVRHLPDGRDEEYLVLDSGYVAEFHSIPASYKSKVEKKTAIKRSPFHAGTVYNVNFSGANSRFNLHSLDLSSNLVDVDPDGLFQELRTAIARDIEDEARSDAMLKQVAEMKKVQGTPKFLEAYQAFISSAADHMTVVVPFIPALTQLLGNLNS